MSANATTKLTSENVSRIYEACCIRLKELEKAGKRTRVEGVVTAAIFHPRRLEDHKAMIEAMLDELSDDFKMPGGGGMSFLAACYDKHGNQWTDSQLRMEQLFLLGLAIGKVECQLPRRMWPSLPGGVPYYVII